MAIAKNIWRLKKGSDRKFRMGHPWVFSSELAQSPKGVSPGELVELRDAGDGFLAIGYGHPQSQISFRTLSLANKVSIDAQFLAQRLRRASSLRRCAGVHAFSHRLCFAEGDFLPGLIIDRYRLRLEQGPNSLPKSLSELAHSNGQVFVIQSSTAGMELLLPAVYEALEILVNEEALAGEISWQNSAIVVANDSKSRILEGLSVEPKSVFRDIPGLIANAAHIVIEPGAPGLAPLKFEVDLITGQKTGFFLDQRLNIQLASRLARELLSIKAREPERRAIRILDLCCYVGQWGTQLGHLATQMGIVAEVTLADASQKALEIAARNVEAHGAKAILEKMDVLDQLSRLPQRAYDIVICDPPAFIKKKKDLPTGGQAYFKMNREAVRRVATGGLFVSCSCSGLFDETEFRSMLARVSAGHSGEMRWLLRGSHSPDHPQRPEFPQGTYLKSWMGMVY
jgi:23S rRNA (cytosine1962-C5)-methyltransferase